jgi:tetratricopeptide (TPR) repeat protein
MKITLVYGLLFYALLLLSACNRDKELREQIDTRLKETAQLEDPFQMAALAQQQLTTAAKIDYQQGIADADFLLGRANKLQGHYNLAITHHLQALEVRKQIGDEAGEAKSYNNLGNICLALDLHKEAVDYYQQALEANQRLGKPEEIAKIYRNLGLVFQKMEKWENAQQYYEQSLNVYTKLNDKERKGKLYNDLAVVQEMQAKKSGNTSSYELALKLYQMAMEASNKAGAQQGLGLSYLNIGRMNIRLGQYEQALDYLQKAEPLLAAAKDYPDLVLVYTRLGEAYRQLEKTTQALEALQKAEQLEGKLAANEKEKIGETYKVFQQVYATSHNQAALQSYRQKEVAMVDEVQKMKEQGRTEQLEQQVRVKEAERAFTADQVQVALNRSEMLMITMVSMGAIFVILMSLLLYQYRKMKKSLDVFKTFATALFPNFGE